jgi:hypothetical protein
MGWEGEENGEKKIRVSWISDDWMGMRSGRCLGWELLIKLGSYYK